MFDLCFVLCGPYHRVTVMIYLSARRCINDGHRRMEVTHYSLCHGSPTDGCDLVNWACEGYDSSIKM